MNYELQELNEKEMMDINGGILVLIVAFAIGAMHGYYEEMARQNSYKH